MRDAKAIPHEREYALELLKMSKEKLVDKENLYVHVIITSCHDTSSKAELSTLIEINSMMKQTTTHAKTAVIQYQAKYNQRLREELVKVCLSCEHGLRPEHEESDEEIMLEEIEE